jgi:predicted nucleic acid-binding protein
LDIYGNNNIDFEDALSIATMEEKKISQIYSYDEDFDKVKDCEITRVEPE